MVASSLAGSRGEEGGGDHHTHKSALIEALLTHHADQKLSTPYPTTANHAPCGHAFAHKRLVVEWPSF